MNIAWPMHVVNCWEAKWCGIRTDSPVSRWMVGCANLQCDYGTFHRPIASGASVFDGYSFKFFGGEFASSLRPAFASVIGQVQSASWNVKRWKQLAAFAATSLVSPIYALLLNLTRTMCVPLEYKRTLKRPTSPHLFSC